MIHIVLYEPEIPQNTGNIMRTCAGTGSKLHLIEPLGFSLDEKHLKRSAVNYLPFCEYTVYPSYEDFLSKNEGVFYYFTRYGKMPHTAVHYPKKEENIYLVFGKESTGIPKEILKDHLTSCLRIPMNDHIRALNISNSVAVALYEVLRQQDYPDLLLKEPFKGADYLESSQ